MKSLIRSRPERWSRAVALVLVLALAPLPAVATPISEEAKAQSKAKFLEGNAAYEQGDYRKALEAFDAAYKLAPLPAFLYNVAQCHRQLGAYERAAFFYRRFLALSEKEPANVATVKELIAEMDAKAAPKPAAKAKVAEKERPKAGSSKEETDARGRTGQDSPLKDAERQALDIRTSRSLSVPPGAMPQAPVAEKREPLTRKWWLWAGAGAAALVAGGIVYAVTAPEPRPTTLGTIRGR